MKNDHVGIYLGIVAVFCVLCVIAEALEVPVIYSALPSLLIIMGGIYVAARK